MSLTPEVLEFLEQAEEAAGEAGSCLDAALDVLEDDEANELIGIIAPLATQLETIEHKIYRIHNAR